MEGVVEGVDDVVVDVEMGEVSNGFVWLVCDEVDGDNSEGNSEDGGALDFFCLELVLIGIV